MSSIDTNDTHDPMLGRVLGGRFRVLRALGAGGMGTLYVARQEALERDVALKVVRGGDQRATTARRFEREARAVAQLQHPNVVAVHELGVDDDGTQFIVMELLPGETLGERLRRDRRIRVDVARLLVRDIAAGLKAAHEKAIVHRDLKPDNVMIVEGGGRGAFAKLLDFGLAKPIAAPQDALTEAGVAMGTPGYMAPELLVQGVIDDPRSDLYALGVVWFEMITGQRLFTAKTAMGLAMLHASAERPRAHEVAPDCGVERDEERLMRALLAIDPAERPTSAQQVIAGIEELACCAPSPVTDGPACRAPTAGDRDLTLTETRARLRIL